MQEELTLRDIDELECIGFGEPNLDISDIMKEDLKKSYILQLVFMFFVWNIRIG